MHYLVAYRRGRDEVRRVNLGHRFAHARTIDRAVHVERGGVHSEMHEFVCDGFCDRALRNLRRVVRGILRGPAARLRAEHENNGARFALRHLGDYGLGAKERSVRVDLELEIEVLFADLGETFAQVGAGVVDQHGDRAELALNRRDRRDHLLAARDVSRSDHRFAALRANQFRGFVELRLGPRDQSDRVAFFCHSLRDVAADTASRAGYQSDFCVRHSAES